MRGREQTRPFRDRRLGWPAELPIETGVTGRWAEMANDGGEDWLATAVQTDCRLGTQLMIWQFCLAHPPVWQFDQRPLSTGSGGRAAEHDAVRWQDNGAEVAATA